MCKYLAYVTCAGVMEKLTKKFSYYVPLAPKNTLWRLLDKRATSILDVGCGKGWPMEFINRKLRAYLVGLDIFKPYLLEAKGNKVYEDVVLCDIRKMPIKECSFDVVLCIDTLEHLDREEGLVLLMQLEQVARNQVIGITPLDRARQGSKHENPYQKHRCLWKVEEIKHVGYKVEGSGLRGMAYVATAVPFLKPIIIFVLCVLWIATSVITYNRLYYASGLVYYKNKFKIKA